MNKKNGGSVKNYSPIKFSFQRSYFNQELMNKNLTNYKKNKLLDKLMDRSLKSNKEFSPLSGSEPSYEPDKWNKNKNILDSHNCYAYALNQRVSKRKGKPQPGYFAHYDHISNKEYQDCSSFLNRLKKDTPSLYVTDFETPCKKGFYKNFIAVAKDGYDHDYHFYREDKNGYWSHKPGRTEVTNIDASKKLIKNPSKANRNYAHFNYSKPCFFYCNPKKLSKSASVTK